MSKIIVIIGMGELGELFVRGFLKLGHPVYPVLRNMQLSDVVFFVCWKHSLRTLIIFAEGELQQNAYIEC